MLEKLCAPCGKTKPLAAFNVNRRNKSTGRESLCRECRKQARSRLAPVGFGINRKHHFKKRYGITPEQYEEMERQQRGLCAICYMPETRVLHGRKPRLAVDHNHSTGKVRALLCFMCNAKLATIEDEQFMLRAKAYLRQQDGYQFVNDEG